ncbi:MAG: rhodanese-like domain-containing protein [Vicinamibacterales bacterium]
MLVRQIADPKLAQFAYLVGCPATGEALIIDPQRDIDRYVAEAARVGLRIVAAADTHIHADYLSGLREFAARGVPVYASREGGPDWQYEWLAGSAYPHHLLGDGDTFKVGNIELTAVHTPGHTPEHLSYLVRDGGSGASQPIAIASGDFVFVGDVGRPDLLERAAGITGVMQGAARDQYASIHRVFKGLPEFLQVWPGHGAGSACGKSLGDIPMSTVGYELRVNPSIRAADTQEHFVDFILAGQPEPPAYFARMKRENRSGPAVLGELPRPREVGQDELGALASSSGVVILDTRSRREFLAGHLPGALLTEADYQLSAIAGSYADPALPVYLVVPASRADEVVRGLVRVGIDRIEGIITPDTLAAWAAAGGTLHPTSVIDMGGLERQRLAGTVHVLDVRAPAEFEAGHVPGAINIPHTRLGERYRELPTDRPLAVHCRSGARSAAASSLLERLGFSVVDVNDLFAHYQQATAPAHTAS